MRVYARTIPTRTVISLIDRTPQVSRAEDEPEITLWAKFWLSLPTGENTEPVDLECVVKVKANRTIKVLEIKPKYGSVRGMVSYSVFDIYRDMLIKAAKETDLALIGVE